MKGQAIPMCLGVPGEIISINANSFMPMGKVDFGGVTREVCLIYTPDVKVGDYVVVHVGFAISPLDEIEAQETLKFLSEVGILEDELYKSEESPSLPDPN
jgi:hydrogenase expression/formation protein HypC